MRRRFRPLAKGYAKDTLQPITAHHAPDKRTVVPRRSFDSNLLTLLSTFYGFDHLTTSRGPMGGGVSTSLSEPGDAGVTDVRAVLQIEYA